MRQQTKNIVRASSFQGVKAISMDTGADIEPESGIPRKLEGDESRKRPVFSMWELVWAKLKLTGAWWPAQISVVPPKYRDNLNLRLDEFCVFWFGSRTYSCVPLENLAKFEVNRNDFSHRCTTPMFLRAICDIEDFMEGRWGGAESVISHQPRRRELKKSSRNPDLKSRESQSSETTSDANCVDNKDCRMGTEASTSRKRRSGSKDTLASFSTPLEPTSFLADDVPRLQPKSCLIVNVEMIRQCIFTHGPTCPDSPSDRWNLADSKALVFQSSCSGMTALASAASEIQTAPTFAAVAATPPTTRHRSQRVRSFAAFQEHSESPQNDVIQLVTIGQQFNGTSGSSQVAEPLSPGRSRLFALATAALELANIQLSPTVGSSKDELDLSQQQSKSTADSEAPPASGPAISSSACHSKQSEPYTGNSGQDIVQVSNVAGESHVGTPSEVPSAAALEMCVPVPLGPAVADQEPPACTTQETSNYSNTSAVPLLSDVCSNDERVGADEDVSPDGNVGAGIRRARVKGISKSRIGVFNPLDLGSDYAALVLKCSDGQKIACTQASMPTCLDVAASRSLSSDEPLTLEEYNESFSSFGTGAFYCNMKAVQNVNINFQISDAQEHVEPVLDCLEQHSSSAQTLQYEDVHEFSSTLQHSNHVNSNEPVIPDAGGQKQGGQTMDSAPNESPLTYQSSNGTSATLLALNNSVSAPQLQITDKSEPELQIANIATSKSCVGGNSLSTWQIASGCSSKAQMSVEPASSLLTAFELSGFVDLSLALPTQKACVSPTLNSSDVETISATVQRLENLKSVSFQSLEEPASVSTQSEAAVPVTYHFVENLSSTVSDHLTMLKTLGMRESVSQVVGKHASAIDEPSASSQALDVPELVLLDGSPMKLRFGELSLTAKESDLSETSLLHIVDHSSAARESYGSLSEQEILEDSTFSNQLELQPSEVCESALQASHALEAASTGARDLSSHMLNSHSPILKSPVSGEESLGAVDVLSTMPGANRLALAMQTCDLHQPLSQYFCQSSHVLETAVEIELIVHESASHGVCEKSSSVQLPHESNVSNMRSSQRPQGSDLPASDSLSTLRSDESLPKFRESEVPVSTTRGVGKSQGMEGVLLKAGGVDISEFVSNVVSGDTSQQILRSHVPSLNSQVLNGPASPSPSMILNFLQPSSTELFLDVPRLGLVASHSLSPRPPPPIQSADAPELAAQNASHRSSAQYSCQPSLVQASDSLQSINAATIFHNSHETGLVVQSDAHETTSQIGPSSQKMDLYEQSSTVQMLDMFESKSLSHSNSSSSTLPGVEANLAFKDLGVSRQAQHSAVEHLSICPASAIPGSAPNCVCDTLSTQLRSSAAFSSGMSMTSSTRATENSESIIETFNEPGLAVQFGCDSQSCALASEFVSSNEKSLSGQVLIFSALNIPTMQDTCASYDSAIEKDVGQKSLRRRRRRNEVECCGIMVGSTDSEQASLYSYDRRRRCAISMDARCSSVNRRIPPNILPRSGLLMSDTSFVKAIVTPAEKANNVQDIADLQHSPPIAAASPNPEISHKNIFPLNKFRKKSDWPPHGGLLIPGVNDTWNSYQTFHRGRTCLSDEWRAARRALHEDAERRRASASKIEVVVGHERQCCEKATRRSENPLKERSSRTHNNFSTNADPEPRQEISHSHVLSLQGSSAYRDVHGDFPRSEAGSAAKKAKGFASEREFGQPDHDEASPVPVVSPARAGNKFDCRLKRCARKSCPGESGADGRVHRDEDGPAAVFRISKRRKFSRWSDCATPNSSGSSAPLRVSRDSFGDEEEGKNQGKIIRVGSKQHRNVFAGDADRSNGGNCGSEEFVDLMDLVRCNRTIVSQWCEVLRQGGVGPRISTLSGLLMLMFKLVSLKMPPWALVVRGPPPPHIPPVIRGWMVALARRAEAKAASLGQSPPPPLLRSPPQPSDWSLWRAEVLAGPGVGLAAAAAAERALVRSASLQVGRRGTVSVSVPPGVAWRHLLVVARGDEPGRWDSPVQTDRCVWLGHVSRDNYDSYTRNLGLSGKAEVSAARVYLLMPNCDGPCTTGGPSLPRAAATAMAVSGDECPSSGSAVVSSRAFRAEPVEASWVKFRLLTPEWWAEKLGACHARVPITNTANVTDFTSNFGGHSAESLSASARCDMTAEPASKAAGPVPSPGLVPAALAAASAIAPDLSITSSVLLPFFGSEDSPASAVGEGTGDFVGGSSVDFEASCGAGVECDQSDTSVVGNFGHGDCAAAPPAHLLRIAL